MPLRWEDRAPFLDTAGRGRVDKRFRSCAAAVEGAFGLSRGAIRRAKKLGCGYYGCAYLLPAQPPSRAVIKVTTDPLEANAVMHLLKLKRRGKGSPAGLLRIHGVRELGRCAVTGRDTRTLWAIWREELDDAWPEVKKRGVRLRDFEAALEDLVSYLEVHSSRSMFGPTRQEVVELLEPVGGLALIEACEWLVRHGLFALDVVKPSNLGWRDKTGLVIRDIGATEAEKDVRKDIRKVGGAGGQTLSFIDRKGAYGF
jgi:hypothetical protein